MLLIIYIVPEGTFFFGAELIAVAGSNLSGQHQRHNYFLCCRERVSMRKSDEECRQGMYDDRYYANRELREGGECCGTQSNAIDGLRRRRQRTTGVNGMNPSFLIEYCNRARIAQRTTKKATSTVLQSIIIGSTAELYLLLLSSRYHMYVVINSYFINKTM